MVQRRRVRGSHSPPPLDSAAHESKARSGAVLPQRQRDGSAETERLCAILVFLLALSVRLYRISSPSAVVFDEVHFLRFVKNYRDGEYLFDIHPPLGKLILLGVSRLFCRHPYASVAKIGMPFPIDYDYIPLRVSSAFFGAACTPLLFFIARTLGLALPAALIPAVAFALDHLAVVEARIVVMDAQLSFFMALALLFALQLFGAPRHSRARYRALAGTAIAASCAISVKWTAGVTPFLIAVVSVTATPFMRRSLCKSEMACAGALALTLYVTFFAVHFSLLPNAGRGDAFMSLAFQQTLKNNKHYVSGARGAGFVGNFLYLHARMFLSNRAIKKRHHWESKWYQWVVTQRGILYYREKIGDLSAIIYLIVNPCVAFAALAAVVCSVAIVVGVYLPRKYGMRLEPYSKLHAFAARSAFLLAGYVLNLVPYLGKFYIRRASIFQSFNRLRRGVTKHIFVPLHPATDVR